MMASILFIATFLLVQSWSFLASAQDAGDSSVNCFDHGGDKNTFRDLGYALMGYNKQKAFPLSAGHDPGFQKPIFRTSYSKKGQSADCVYAVPDGWFINPDVSCQTSTTSETIKTSEELDQYLSIVASVSYNNQITNISVGEVEGSGWGASFIASTEYNEMSSQLDVDENVLVFSNAKCQYYYMTMNEVFPPKFTKAFEWWMEKLLNTSDQAVYKEFVDYFGTHFVQEASFGARYSLEYKMTKEQYAKLEEDNVDVEEAATYSGFGIKAEGSVGYSESKAKQSESLFENSVMRTLSVGVTPPSDGDALSWASAVQKYPLPVDYKLCNIEELFTERFMIDYPNINYTFIKQNLESLKDVYEVNPLSVASICRVYESSIILPVGICVSSATFALQRAYTAGARVKCEQDCLDDPECNMIAWAFIANQPNSCGKFNHGDYPAVHEIVVEQGRSGEEFGTTEICEGILMPFRIDGSIEQPAPGAQGKVVVNSLKPDGSVPVTNSSTGVTEDICLLSCIQQSDCVAVHWYADPFRGNVECNLWTSAMIEKTGWIVGTTADHFIFIRICQ